MDPDGIDSLSKGSNKSLFDLSKTIRGSQSAVVHGAACWCPYQEVEDAKDKIRKLVEQCSSKLKLSIIERSHTQQHIEHK